MPNMLRNVLGNLFSRPATRQYPTQAREPFANARGMIEFDTENCIFCGACARRCPAAAITVDRAAKQLTFEPFRCIICVACVEVCPRKCIQSRDQYRAPVYAKSEEVHRREMPAEVENKTSRV
jgi:ech hydrogenase subunit F